MLSGNIIEDDLGSMGAAVGWAIEEGVKADVREGCLLALSRRSRLSGFSFGNFIFRILVCFLYVGILQASSLFPFFCNNRPRDAPRRRRRVRASRRPPEMSLEKRENRKENNIRKREKSALVVDCLEGGA